MVNAAIEKPVLAIYDFRSKQEYIYRTNRMREITGASELIAEMYGRFLASEPRIACDWEQGGNLNCTFNDDVIGEVVYIGGGNLCVLYRSMDDYVECNKRFSLMVLQEAYGLSLIAGFAEWNGDFEGSRTKAYQALDKQKRAGLVSHFSNVLPYTLVDRGSFQPIVTRDSRLGGRELSRESVDKCKAFEKASKESDEERFIDEIAAERGADSLIAVVYFDGNSIGDRLKKTCKTEADIRQFSLEVHSALVGKTVAAIKATLNSLEEQYRRHRIIIDHGDEITLICNAHAAPYALEAYFGALDGSGYEACAGMAICHAHDPFASVYEIAEECCESGKVVNRRSGENASYIDFHFCRSGIMGSLGQIRDAQEDGITYRPYRVNDSYRAFVEIGTILSNCAITRSDLKELNRSMARGHSWYRLEYERLKAKAPQAFSSIEALAEPDALKRILFDVTSFLDVYDLRFKELPAPVCDSARNKEVLING